MKTLTNLFKVSLLGVTGTLVMDMVRNQKIKQITKSSEHNKPLPPQQQQAVKDVYHTVIPNLNGHHLTVIQNPTMAEPFSVDSVLGKKSIVVLPTRLLADDDNLRAKTAHEAGHLLRKSSLRKDFGAISSATLVMYSLFNYGKKSPQVILCAYFTYYVIYNGISRREELQADLAASRKMPGAKLVLVKEFECNLFQDPQTAAEKLKQLTASHPTYQERLNNIEEKIKP